MEQILEKLAEIETAAAGIAEEADRRRNTLSEKMEKERKTFDKLLASETDEKVKEIRRNLEQEKDDSLSGLRKTTEASLAGLDVYYEKNHERLSQALFEKIIQI